MTDVDGEPGSRQALPPPPPLPPRLVDLRPVLAAGTAGWLIGLLVLLLTGDRGAWMWTCLAGAVLGLVGFAIMGWQRAAARRGSRGAQDGL